MDTEVLNGKRAERTDNGIHKVEEKSLKLKMLLWLRRLSKSPWERRNSYRFLSAYALYTDTSFLLVLAYILVFYTHAINSTWLILP